MNKFVWWVLLALAALVILAVIFGPTIWAHDQFCTYERGCP